MPSVISTLGQQLNLVSRMKDIQSRMTDYQQQITTGVKYQNFAGYGFDTQKIQRYRATLQDMKTYNSNIDIAQVNISQMDKSISENMKQAQNVLSALGLQLSQGTAFDLNNIKQMANSALQIIEGNINTEVGGRYLFSGSDVSNKPITNSENAKNNMSQRVTDWLDGTDTLDNFLDGFDAMNDTESGYSQTLQTAKKIYARADDNYEIDYTVMANSEGFKKIVNGLRMLSQMEMPDATVDVAVKEDFYTVIDHIYASVQSGVEGLRADSSKLGTAAAALATITANHDNDTQNMQKILESTESANTTDAIIKFQTLQTQLEASYNITAVISQLSLARFLGGG